MSRGKPFEEGNTLGKGRPPGSLNKTSLLLQKMLLDNGEEIMEKAIELAIKGHPVARKLVMDRLVPRLKDVAEQPVEKSLESPNGLEIDFFDSDGTPLPGFGSAQRDPRPQPVPVPPPESAPRQPVQSAQPRPPRRVYNRSQ